MRSKLYDLMRGTLCANYSESRFWRVLRACTGLQPLLPAQPHAGPFATLLVHMRRHAGGSQQAPNIRARASAQQRADALQQRPASAPRQRRAAPATSGARVSPCMCASR